MALPEMMRAIEIAQPGGPEVLRPATRPLPKPGPGEVLIKVAAAVTWEQKHGQLLHLK